MRSNLLMTVSDVTTGSDYVTNLNKELVYTCVYVLGENKAHNPCDGHCHDNPSGLYADLSDSKRFIQCGDGMNKTVPCRCCRPYYLACPEGTTFDSDMRVCNKSYSYFVDE